MHELAITESIIATVEERANGARILRVLVDVGALTCVEPDALRFCFAACARGTALYGAELEIREVPARARCRTCASEGSIADPRIPLCACGSADLELLDGGQLRVSAVEVV